MQGDKYYYNRSKKPADIKKDDDIGNDNDRASNHVSKMVANS